MLSFQVDEQQIIKLIIRRNYLVSGYAAIMLIKLI